MGLAKPFAFSFVDTDETFSFEDFRLLATSAPADWVSCFVSAADAFNPFRLSAGGDTDRAACDFRDFGWRAGSDQSS